MVATNIFVPGLHPKNYSVMLCSFCDFWHHIQLWYWLLLSCVSFHGAFGTMKVCTQRECFPVFCTYSRLYICIWRFHVRNFEWERSHDICLSGSELSHQNLFYFDPYTNFTCLYSFLWCICTTFPSSKSPSGGIYVASIS